MKADDPFDSQNDSERWMVSYADFITLLFGFFVVMYAISSVNNEKYKVLSQTLAEAFSVDALSAELIKVGEPTQRASPHVIDLPDSHGAADQTDGDTFVKDPATTAESLLGGFNQHQGVALEVNHDWVEMSIGGGLLFAPGQAVLSNEGLKLLEPAIEIALNSSQPITVEGYTDNIPIESFQFPSNWNLSAARASAVAQQLVESGVRAERITAVGYGENHPIATNATPAGRSDNRRVVIVVARKMESARNLNSKSNLKPPAPEFANPFTDITSAGIIRATTQDSPALASQRTSGGGLLITQQNSALAQPPEASGDTAENTPIESLDDGLNEDSSDRQPVNDN